MESHWSEHVKFHQVSDEEEIEEELNKMNLREEMSKEPARIHCVLIWQWVATSPPSPKCKQQACGGFWV